MVFTALIIKSTIFHLFKSFSPDGTVVITERDEAKSRIEDIVKAKSGVAKEMMSKGNYGRALLERDVSDAVVAAMEGQVRMAWLET